MTRESNRHVCRITSDDAETNLPVGDLLSLLEELLPIRFVGADSRHSSTSEICFGSQLDHRKQAPLDVTELLELPFPRTELAQSPERRIEVEFCDVPEVPFPFRGRETTAIVRGQPSILDCRRDETVLASSHNQPIWTVSIVGTRRHFRSAIALPDVLGHRNFSDVFDGDHFLPMLPLLHFLREVTTARAYLQPPLRAAYIIDDPNLHWTTYGHVDYQTAADHAERHNYHVAFATIPLDSWYTHEQTARVLRRSSRWLSLLVHGNDHAKNELAISYPPVSRTALLNNALERIRRLERKSGLSVSRIMVPPHGACSSEMLAALPRCGFEAACISAGSLRAHNPNSSWVKTLGFSPAEVVEQCSVLPRWGFDGNVKNTLLVAAYLGRPLILRGHHQDLANELSLLDEWARFINGLGNVFWSNTTDLARLSYLRRIAGETLFLRPSAARIDVEIPERAENLVIEHSSAIDARTWEVVFTNGSVLRTGTDECVAIPAGAGPRVSIERVHEASPASMDIPIHRTSSKLLLRRLLTEARDRIL